MTRRENEYGMTYSEWHAAATFGVRGKLSDFGTTAKAMRAGWKAGEDPTDWCADFHAKMRMVAA